MSSSVRLSVCLSVTLVHPTHPIEIFGNVSAPFNTLLTWRHPGKILRRSSQGNAPVGGLNQRFWTFPRLYLGLIEQGSDLMKLYLMESYCYPVLSYALECFNLSNGCVRQLDACWNSVYRRIFLFKPWESVREQISYLERMNLEYLYYQKKLCFLNSMTHSDNNVIISVLGAFIHSVEFNKLGILYVYLLMTAGIKLSVVWKRNSVQGYEWLNYNVILCCTYFSSLYSPRYLNSDGLPGQRIWEA